jgi:hypothetical protein
MCGVVVQTSEAARGHERLLKQDIFQLEHSVARRRKLRAERAAADAADEMEEEGQAADEQARNCSKKSHSRRMLVDLYRPTSFINLLSDERVNRNVLSWLKEWDPIVFGTFRDEKANPAGAPLPVRHVHSPLRPLGIISLS